MVWLCREALFTIALWGKVSRSMLLKGRETVKVETGTSALFSRVRGNRSQNTESQIGSRNYTLLFLFFIAASFFDSTVVCTEFESMCLV